VEVETVDFSTFLKQFRGMQVYVKMDIEGAEFRVLRKCIEDGTCDIIKTLWVEWHTVDLIDESPHTVQYIKDNLNGVVIYDWK
jgi:hypothetical protein